MIRRLWIVVFVAGVYSQDGGDNIRCTMLDGRQGECVKFYFCKDKTAINADIGEIDSPIIDFNCPSSTQVCCQRSDIIPPDQVSDNLPKQPKREGCGWGNPNGAGVDIKGINEDTTKFGEFPWVVAIMRSEKLDELQPEGKRLNVYIGAGSIIHPSVVLSVAHYVSNPKNLRIRAGEWDTQTTMEIFPHQERDIASVEIHKDYLAKSLFYDIAVVFLAQPLDLAPHIGVACLPTFQVPQKEGVRCFTNGWGKDKFGQDGRYQVTLKKVEVPVVNHDDCQAALRKTRLGRHFTLHSTFMCAGGELGKDACKGDGGAPLSCPIENQKDRFVQSGIVAWGIGCGQDGPPGVYVDVAVLRDWIDDKVIGKGFNPKTYTY